MSNVLPDVQTSHVLFVCTANQCRSPLGAALLRTRLQTLAPDVIVDSTGVSAIDGIPATSPTVTAAAALGVDLAQHRSTRLAVPQVRSANLIVGMERRHVQEAVLLDPSVFSRSFTLKELARRGRAVGRRGYRETLAEWTSRVNTGRRPIDLLGASRDDDLEDPTTNPLVEHDSTAAEIDELVATIAELIWNPLGFD